LLRAVMSNTGFRLTPVSRPCFTYITSRRFCVRLTLKLGWQKQRKTRYRPLAADGRASVEESSAAGRVAPAAGTVVHSCRCCILRSQKCNVQHDSSRCRSTLATEGKHMCDTVQRGDGLTCCRKSIQKGSNAFSFCASWHSCS